MRVTRVGLGARMGSCIALAAAAFVAGCGGGGGGGAPAGGGSPAPVNESALKTAAPGEVVAFFKEQIRERAAQGLDGTQAGGPGVVFSPAPVTAGDGFAGTILQEAGVDEDDRIKTDGTMLYALHPSRTVDGTTQPERLAAARIQADGSLLDAGAVTLDPDYLATGMYLQGQRLAVLSQRQGFFSIQPAPAATTLPAPQTQVIALDVFGVAAGTRPAQQHRVEIDGWLVGSRRIGDVLYLVSGWAPQLSHYPVPANSSATQVAQALANLQAEELMPKIRVDAAAPQPLVNETDCYLQPANASLGLQLTTITAIDLASPTLQRASRCFVGDGNALYVSKDNVYIASSQQVWIANAFAAMVFPRDVTTDIHKFALRGLGIEYRGSGQVPGHLGWDSEKMPLRMSEYNGDLRVVSFTGETGWAGEPAAATPQSRPSPATLTILREDAGSRSLAVVAKLPNAQRPAALGKDGEQVYAVHFAGPRGYVVTFRRTDPLYVLDLANPADPKAVGELTLPGFSEFLFPLAGGDMLLGVGRDADARGVALGLKLALFDVRDPAQPRVAASRTLGARGTASALDHSRHGINILEAGGKARIALPVLVTEELGTSTRMSYQGLARYEADTTAGTLTERPAVIATRFDGTSADTGKFSRYHLPSERAVQSTNATYYLSGGEVVFTREP